jgi:putative nucleotidyltransferase with HDIG domain
MIRLLLNIVLIISIFLSCYFEDAFLTLWQPRVGERAPVGLRLPQPDAGRGLPHSRQANGVWQISPPQVIVPFMKTLDEQDIRLIDNYRRDVSATNHRDTPFILFTMVFMVGFVAVFLDLPPHAGSRSASSPNLILTLLILHLLLLKVLLLAAPWPAAMLPFGVLPLLLVALNQRRTAAVGVSLAAAVLASLFVDRSYPGVIAILAATLTALAAAYTMPKRLAFLWPAVLIGTVNAALFAVLNSFDWQAAARLTLTLRSLDLSSLSELVTQPVVRGTALAFCGGFLAGPLALLLLPVLRATRYLSTAIKLRRFADLDHPALKKLFSDARGTYQHSIGVAHLARSVGAAVDADSLLLRIGGYYHDIGKMLSPSDFIENQFNTPNPHDSLSPQESAQRIFRHVTEGVRLAAEYRLPKMLVDLIPQHHGTLLLDYFYTKAVKGEPTTEIRKRDFRYPGPKPQSREAAILMVADAVEAASRTLEQPNRHTFERLVRLIIVKRIADGQFSECNLDTIQIEKIIDALVDGLEAMFHGRIRYPWQQEATP